MRVTDPVNLILLDLITLIFGEGYSLYKRPVYLKCILILSTHLHLRLPNGIYLSDFPTKILYTSLFSAVNQNYEPVTALLLFHPTSLSFKWKSSGLWRCVIFW